MLVVGFLLILAFRFMFAVQSTSTTTTGEKRPLARAVLAVACRARVAGVRAPSVWGLVQLCHPLLDYRTALQVQPSPAAIRRNSAAASAAAFFFVVVKSTRVACAAPPCYAVNSFPQGNRLMNHRTITIREKSDSTSCTRLEIFQIRNTKTTRSTRSPLGLRFVGLA